MTLPSRRRALWRALAAAFGMAGLAALTRRAGAADAASAPSGAEAAVEMRDYAFHPPVLAVRAGTTVRWANAEKRTSHSVVLEAPVGLEGERLFPGESWSYRFDAPGRYPYHCGPHPEMRGRIDVSH